MKSVFARAGALTVVLASAALMAGSQASPDTAQAPAAAPAPAALPPAPPIVLAPAIVQAAAAYEAYVKHATALTPTFVDGESIQASLRQGEAYEPKALARETVAFAAIVALQEPTFVEGIRAAATDQRQRDKMIRKIEEDANYAATLPGAPAAATLIAAKLGADGRAIAVAGYAIKQSAYSIQHQKWSKEFVKDRDGRLAMAKQLSETAATSTSSEEDIAMMQAAVSGRGVVLPTSSAPPPQTPYTTGVNRSLAIAALAVLGAAGEDNADYVQPLMDENVGAPCLKLAKLNLFECLAVAKPHYEDVFCLGQHALMDTGECVSRTAGVVPAAYETPPVAKPAAKGKRSRHGAATHTAHKRHTT